MKAHEMVARVRCLPSISLPALQLVTLLGDHQRGIEEAVAVIAQDAALTAKLLRACNSPCLALAAPVASVNQAVMLLGHNRVYNMVVASSLRPTLDVALSAYSTDARALWSHSLLAATAAELAATQSPKIDLDGATAFTIGLLHDIGKLITGQFLTEQSLGSLKLLMAKGQSGIEAEQNVLGTDHAEVGAALAYVWRLPDLLVEAIGLHHTPPSALGPASLSYFADRAAHRAENFGEGGEPFIPEAESKIFQAMGFSDETLQSFVDQVMENSVKTEELAATSC